MNITDILYAKKLSGGGGGGGSSDFSTAEVTVIGNTRAVYPIVVSNHPRMPDCIYLEVISDTTAAIALYKGMTVILNEQPPTSITGEAEYDEGALIITGDCTITFNVV